MQIKTISSLQTYPFKMLSYAWLVIGVLFVLKDLKEMSGVIDFIGTILFGALWLLVTVRIVIPYLTKLKEVKIDENNLYVSNFRKEIIVPVKQIKAISEAWLFMKGYTFVTIELKNPTPFGRKIIFLNRFLYGSNADRARELLFLPPITEHPLSPILIELKQLAGLEI